MLGSRGPWRKARPRRRKEGGCGQGFLMEIFFCSAGPMGGRWVWAGRRRRRRHSTSERTSRAASPRDRHDRPSPGRHGLEAAGSLKRGILRQGTGLKHLQRWSDLGGADSCGPVWPRFPGRSWECRVEEDHGWSRTVQRVYHETSKSPTTKAMKRTWRKGAGVRRRRARAWRHGEFVPELEEKKVGHFPLDGGWLFARALVFRVGVNSAHRFFCCPGESQQAQPTQKF